MKKVTLTDLNGKEIEVYFADDKTAEKVTHSDEYKVDIENIPSNKNWAEMTGGQYNDPNHPLNKHDEGQTYWMQDTLGEQDVNEGSAGEGAHESFYKKLNKEWVNKVKQLEQFGSQIKIDDTIPSDFVKPENQRFGAIYKASGLNLIAKLADELTTDENKTLLKMKRHGTVFYVEEGTLIKATALEVQTYLEESK